MRTISTGEPSTLKTYRNIALALSFGNENTEVVKFFDDKIAKSRKGENTEVIADESQMMLLIMQIIINNLK